MKLEAKLQNLQVEWNGGSDTMDEILARIQQREEAAVKRERAMAYAFNHQWRARSATSLGSFSYEVGKGGWGWSWMDRSIAARPWEPQSLVHPENPKKAQAKKNSNTNPSGLKLQGSISLSNNANDRKVPKKKSSPSTPDQKKPSPSPTDQKKPSPSPSRSEENDAEGAESKGGRHSSETKGQANERETRAAAAAAAASGSFSQRMKNVSPGNGY